MSGPQKSPIGWIVFVGVIILVIVAGVITFRVSQNNTTRMTSADQAFVERQTGISQADMTEIEDRAMSQTQQILGGQDTATPATSDVGLPPIKNTWKIQTSAGALTLIYRETESAKGKIGVDVQNNTLIIKNRLDRSISFTNLGTWGETTEGELGPKEEFRADLIKDPPPMPPSGKVEFWFQVNN